MVLALTEQIFSRLFMMSVKRGRSEKVWLPNCDLGTIENGSNFKG
jgi:hypothetical protein